MSIVNTQYKSSFTKQEREECFAWFERHFDELPQTMKSIRSIRVTNLPATVRRMINVLRKRMNEGHTFNGEFSLLLLIRQHLIEEGAVADDSAVNT